MKYDDPELLDALAAEYVVGTLRGPARRRFERLMMESVAARQAVDHWSGLLGGLGGALPGEQPPARVWKRIEQSIDPGRRGPALRFWQLWGLAASLATVVLAMTLVLLPAPSPSPASRVAVFEDDRDQPMWVITADLDTGTLRARAVNARAADADRAYELWMLPADGPPRSLGLLPVAGQAVSHDIPPALRALLGSAQGLAVSLEPPGGSPTGLPTGPVLFQASVLEL